MIKEGAVVNVKADLNGKALAVQVLPGNSPLRKMRLVVNGKEIQCDPSPVLENGRALVPLRAFMQAFGASVKYNADKREITVKKGGVVIVLHVNKAEVFVNGKKKILDVPCLLVNGRAIVPIRFVAESVGAKVSYDAGKGVVSARR